MCAVSVVTAWGQSITNWTPQTFGEFKGFVRTAQDLDLKLGLPNCEDPAKGEWMKSMEQRFAEAEGLQVP